MLGALVASPDLSPSRMGHAPTRTQVRLRTAHELSITRKHICPQGHHILWEQTQEDPEEASSSTQPWGA